MNKTKCDIIRDMSNAVTCGMCNALPSGKQIPHGCGQPPPVSVCSIPGAANVKMKLEQLPNITH